MSVFLALLIKFCFPGGTLRIYADSLKPNIPYKTILLSTTDTADFAVIEALEKYGLEKENPKDYCIARVSEVEVTKSVFSSCLFDFVPCSRFKTKWKDSGSSATNFFFFFLNLTASGILK